MEMYDAPSWIWEFIEQDSTDINTITRFIETYESSRGYENRELIHDMIGTENFAKWLYELMLQNQQHKKKIIDLMQSNLLKYNLTAGEILEALNKDKSLRIRNDICDSLLLIVIKSKIFSGYEQEKLLEEIIDKEPETINEKNIHGESAISVAVSLGKMHIVKRLIDVPECDVNIRDNAENTPLLLAISSDQGTEIAKLLLRVPSVDVNASNKEDTFPLLLATEKSNCELVKLCLNHHKCDVKKTSCNGDTALHVALKKNIHSVIEIFKESDELKTALKVLNKQGESPLSIHLKRFGDCTPFEYDFWKDLSKYTPTKEIVNCAHHTLAAAVERCPVHVCKRLLKAGADVNSSYPDGQTALILAISARCHEKVKLLLKYKPACSGQDIYQHAIESGCDNNILQMLCNHFNLKKAKNHVSLHSTRLNNCNIEYAVTTVPQHQNICSLVQDDVLSVLNEIGQKTKNTPETSYLSFDAKVVGSLTEQTCALGDIDIACIMKETDGILLDDKWQVLKVSENSPWGTCCNGRGILCPKLTNDKFCEHLSLRFKEHTNPKNTSVVTKFYFQQRDKVPCIRVLASCQEVQREIYVDIVPIFNINNTSFIPKVSRHNNDLNVDLRFPISRNIDESEVISKTSDTQKSALKLAKLLRISKACNLDENQLKACHLNPMFDKTNFVTSYMLKHSLLRVRELKWLEVKANHIISQLSSDVSMGRIESHFDGSTILHCKHNYGKPLEFYNDDCVFEACCLKRITAFHMCQNMIKWMSSNPGLEEELHAQLLQQDATDSIKAILHAQLLQQPGPAAPALSGLLDRQWKHKKSVELPEVPYSLRSLRLIDDQLWQCHSKGISVFTVLLKPVRQIGCRDMGCICDVASTGPKEVVVAARKGLYSLNRKGKGRKSIAKGCFTSVCLHEDQLYTARDDYHTVYGTDCCTISVYRWSGSRWTESSRFSVEGIPASLSVNSDGVYMCLSLQHKFNHYTHSGELLSSIGSEGRGIEINFPILCSVDSAGTALIAYFGNHRLKLLSSGGTWRFIYLQPPVKRTYCALFCNDRLYVNSWWNHSLKMYI